MWQAINPNTFVTGQAATNDTVTTAAGTIENIRTPLTPFWKDPQDFYTSAEVRGTERFGHAYPETQPWNFESARDYQASVRAAFRNLYGGSNLGFILASTQRGSLSSRAQIQTPNAEAQTSQAGSQIAAPLNQAGSLLKGSIQKVASISASVVASAQQGHGGKQVPLRDAGKPHDGKGHENPKDTVKDTESAPHDKGKGATDDDKSDHAPKHQSKSRGCLKDLNCKLT